MAKTKQGDSLSCSVCGLVVAVDEVYGYADTMVVCCDKPMVKGKRATDTARKKKAATAKAKIAPPKPAAKVSAKPAVRPAVKKSVKAPKM